MLNIFFEVGTCALASHIALEEAGVEYQATHISFRENQQSSTEFLAVNPKGRVPALVTDRGVLTETPAILAYIAQTFPDKKLAPINDPFAFGRVQAFTNYLCSTVHVAHAHRMRGQRWASQETSFEDMRRKVPQSVGDCIGLIENDMLAGPWVMGEDYTICDPYLLTVSRWLKGDSVDVSRFPKVADHMNRMQERPAVQKVLDVWRAAAA